MGSEFIKRKSSVSASKSDAKPSLFAKRPSSVQRRNKRTPNTQLKNNPLTLDSLFAKLGSNIHPEEIQQKCDDCESESVQTKLTIGEPGDKYEQEADATAAQVMAMSDESVQRQNSQQTEETLVQQNPNPITQEDKKPQNGLDFVFAKLGSNIHPGKIQSKATDKNQVNPSLENRLSTSKGGGNPLPDNVRTFMEPRFGADFSEVRTHTDSGAVQMNKELGAQAFAHGNDIYYGGGKSPGNDELTAHELTHTIQQGGGKQLQGKYEQQEDVVARKESAENQEKLNNQAMIALLGIPSLPTVIPQSVLKKVGTNVSKKLLWSKFWKVVAARFAIRGTAAGVLAAADGPIPVGDLISLGIAIWTIWEIFQLWDELWEQVANEFVTESEVENPSNPTDGDTSNDNQSQKKPKLKPKPKPIPPKVDVDEDDKKPKLYAFGNKTHPREPRPGRDIKVDEGGYVRPQPEVGKKWPDGASTFSDPNLAPLKKHYHSIPKDTPMPPGLSIMADGNEFGGPHAPTHHTIFPVQRMLFLTFSNLFLGLPWKYAGNKK